MLGARGLGVGCKIERSRHKNSILECIELKKDHTNALLEIVSIDAKDGF